MMYLTLFVLSFCKGSNDGGCHKAVLSALKVIGFTQDEIDSIYKIIGTILLLVGHFFYEVFEIVTNGEVACRYSQDQKWLLKCYMNLGNSLVKNMTEGGNLCRRNLNKLK